VRDCDPWLDELMLWRFKGCDQWSGEPSAQAPGCQQPGRARSPARARDEGDPAALLNIRRAVLLGVSGVSEVPRADERSFRSGYPAVLDHTPRSITPTVSGSA
jgi:hypothetical protein